CTPWSHLEDFCSRWTPGEEMTKKKPGQLSLVGVLAIRSVLWKSVDRLKHICRAYHTLEKHRQGQTLGFRLQVIVQGTKELLPGRNFFPLSECLLVSHYLRRDLSNEMVDFFRGKKTSLPDVVRDGTGPGHAAARALATLPPQSLDVGQPGLGPG